MAVTKEQYPEFMKMYALQPVHKADLFSAEEQALKSLSEGGIPIG